MNNIPLKPVLLIDFLVNCFLKLFIKQIAGIIDFIRLLLNFLLIFMRTKLNNTPLEPVLLIYFIFDGFLKLFIKEIAILVDLILFFFSFLMNFDEK